MVFGYTAEWTWASEVLASSTQTIMKSFRVSDDTLAWQGNLECYGQSGSGNGINCNTLSAGTTNPQGGAGCQISMGKRTNAGWHHWFMGHSNLDLNVV